MSYTIGIQRRVFPGFRKYLVIGHEFRAEPTPRVILWCKNGNQYAVPGLDWRTVRVYPDYQVHENETPLPESPPPDIGAA